MRPFILLCLVASTIAQADQDTPAFGEDSQQQEQSQASAQQEAFVKNVGCYILMQKKLHQSDQHVRNIRKNPKGHLGMKRAVSGIFKACMQGVDPSTVMQAVYAKSREELDGIQAPAVEDFDVEAVANNIPDANTEEEEAIYKAVEQIEKEIQKMQKNNQKGNANQKQDEYNYEEDDEEDYSDPQRKDKSTLMGYDFQSFTGPGTVLIILGVLGVSIYAIWTKLFGASEQEDKKSKKKKGN